MELIRDVWDLVRLPGSEVTEFRFVGPVVPGAGPQIMLQIDAPEMQRYIVVARLGDWPDVNLIWQLAHERLKGPIGIMRVPDYPEQRGLRFWYARGTARIDGVPRENVCFSPMDPAPNKEVG